MADLPRHPEPVPRSGRSAHGSNADAGTAPMSTAAVLARWAALRRALRWRAGVRTLPRLSRYWSVRLSGRLRSQLARGRSTPSEEPRANGAGAEVPGKEEIASLVVRAPAAEEAAEGRAEPGTRQCSFVRDFAPDGEVLREEEIQRLSRHAAQCLQCMEHFIALVGDTATGSSTS